MSARAQVAIPGIKGLLDEAERGALDSVAQSAWRALLVTNGALAAGTRLHRFPKTRASGERPAARRSGLAAPVAGPPPPLFRELELSGHRPPQTPLRTAWRTKAAAAHGPPARSVETSTWPSSVFAATARRHTGRVRVYRSEGAAMRPTLHHRHPDLRQACARVGDARPARTSARSRRACKQAAALPRRASTRRPAYLRDRYGRTGAGPVGGVRGPLKFPSRVTSVDATRLLQ